MLGLRPVSDKRRHQLAEYAGLAAWFLSVNPTCEVCREHPSVEVHHRRGREGKRLLQTGWWLAVCRVCHQKITNSPAWARSQGYTISRMGVDK